MMEDNKQLALRIDGAVQSASQEVTNLRAELTATNRSPHPAPTLLQGVGWGWFSRLWWTA